MQYHDAYNCGVALNDNWTVHLLVSIWSLGRRKHGLADKLKEATWDWIWRFHSKCFLGFERNANQRIQTSGIDSECFLRLETWTSKLNMKLKLKLFVKFERVCWHDPWYMMRKCEINAQESGIFWQFKIDFQKICNCFFFTGDWSKWQAHRETIVRPSTRPPSQVFLIVPWQSFLLWLFHIIPYHSFLFHIIPDYSISFIVFP